MAREIRESLEIPPKCSSQGLDGRILNTIVEHIDSTFLRACTVVRNWTGSWKWTKDGETPISFASDNCYHLSVTYNKKYSRGRQSLKRRLAFPSVSKALAWVLEREICRHHQT